MLRSYASLTDQCLVSIRNLKRQDPVLPLMMELHWLPLRFRITFKLCVLMPGVHYGTGPKCMKELVTPNSSLPGRERRSAATMNYDIERTKLKFGERSFAVSGPTAWNTLPANLKCIGNILSFKRNLKTHLFSIAYTCKN